MKKIKAFFAGLIARLRKWWTSTLIPVKRVVLLCTLLSLVAFGVGSCSAKKPYQTASAASESDTNVLWITINYQPQFYYPNSLGTDVKLATDTQLVIRNGNMYYKFFKTEYLLSATSVNASVYYMMYSESSKVYNYSSMPIQVASSLDSDILSKVSEGSYIISDITFENEVKYFESSKVSHNYCFFNFRYSKVGGGDSGTLGAVMLSCPSSVPSGYSLSLNSVPYFNFSIITSQENSQLYRLGYEEGYNKGLSESLSDIEPWQVIVDALDTFMNIKLFGTISLGTVLKVGLSLLLVGLIIKIFLGG